MHDQELLDKILNAPFVFWTCPVCVRPEVKWVDGGLWAFCINCGRKSTEGKKTMVVDKNGVEIVAGQRVLVHQEEETREAVVLKPFPDAPTKNQEGHWVDINIDNQGAEGMPSYILEVVQ